MITYLTIDRFEMEEGLKQRLVGTLVLTLLAVIFVPLMFEEETRVASISHQKPADFPADFDDHIVAIPERSEIIRKIDEMEKKAEKASANTSDLKAWAIQVGSFSKAENARDFRDKLRKKAFTAFVETANENNKTLYRVRVGPVLKKKDAEAKMKRIQTMFDVKGLVVAYP